PADVGRQGEAAMNKRVTTAAVLLAAFPAGVGVSAAASSWGGPGGGGGGGGGGGCKGSDHCPTTSTVTVTEPGTTVTEPGTTVTSPPVTITVPAPAQPPPTIVVTQ